jgi:hypothetical protein
MRDKLWNGEVVDGCFRTVLRHGDLSHFWRTLALQEGFSTREAAHLILDRWFRPVTPDPPSPALLDAPIHYSPQWGEDSIEGDGERFELGRSC